MRALCTFHPCPTPPSSRLFTDFHAVSLSTKCGGRLRLADAGWGGYGVVDTLYPPAMVSLPATSAASTAAPVYWLLWKRLQRLAGLLTSAVHI